MTNILQYKKLIMSLMMQMTVISGLIYLFFSIAADSESTPAFIPYPSLEPST